MLALYHQDDVTASILLVTICKIDLVTEERGESQHDGIPSSSGYDAYHSYATLVMSHAKISSGFRVGKP